MWTGFAAEKIEPIDDQALALEYSMPFINHMHDVWTSGNREHTNYGLACFGFKFQHPGMKPGVAFYLYGDEGCGKRTIPDIARTKLFGTHCSYQTSNPEADIFGPFAQGLYNSQLTQIDETTSTHRQADRLKDFITGATFNYRAMYHNPVVMDNLNLAMIIFTSNNENSLKITASDRRFVLFHCSNVHKGDVEYFERLHAFYEEPKHVRGLYEYLMAFPTLSPISRFQTERPITEFYHEMQLANLPIVHRFLSALANSQVSGIIKTENMFKQFKELLEACNIPFHITYNTFCKGVKGVLGKENHKPEHHVSRYQIMPADVKARLQALNSYDHEITMPS